MKTIEERIHAQLDQVTREHDVTILYACESGSRAWGFASPDSDYDVRFIYCHNRDWYLTLGDPKDTITVMVDATLDLVGWDLRKALRLAVKSNASPLEWTQSPIEYRSLDGFRANFHAVIRSRFSPISVAWHYFSMARNTVDAMGEDEAVKLKRYFYALRTALCVLWIVRNKTMAPLEFHELLPLIDDAPTVDRIRELVALKATKDESYLHPREPLLDALLGSVMAECEPQLNDLPASTESAEKLNQFFRTTLNQLQ